MNKKFYLAALALPFIMAACSSEETLSDVQSVKDQFEGIAKVDAQFYTDDLGSRLIENWGLEKGDKIGMAWLGVPDSTDASVYGSVGLPIQGYAYQNHPLTAQGGRTLTPQTSIYVGRYFIYHPYNAEVRHLSNVGFDLAEQPLTDVNTKPAIKSIHLSSKWTDITLNGDENEMNIAGEAATFKVSPRQFSNLVNLDLDWKNNDVLAEKIEEPIIDEIKVGYLNENGDTVSVTGFEYAPKDWNDNNYDDDLDDYTYWGNFNLQPATSRAAAVKMKALGEKAIAMLGLENVQEGLISLTPEEGEYVVEGTEKGNIFWYNALPATEETDSIYLEILTDYGVIKYGLKMNEVAKTPDYLAETIGYKDAFDGDENDYPATEEYEAIPTGDSFMNRLFKSGKIKTEVDFLDADMNGMHVEDDPHLQKLLNFYLLKMENENYEEGCKLYLDADADGEFKISKTSITLMQQINEEVANPLNVALYLCNNKPAPHNGIKPTIVVTNNEEEGQEVPSFHKVFGQEVDVYLSKDCTWTWGGSLAARTASSAKKTGMVTMIYNRGTLNINADVETDNQKRFEGLTNLKDATINVNKKIAAYINAYNQGEMIVKDEAEYWVANGFEFVNEAESLEEFGTIENNGVITVTEAEDGKESGSIINYGYILNNSTDSNKNVKTYITSNQTPQASFVRDFAKGRNMFGTIMLNNKFDNVSVTNQTEEGFIKYAWNAAEDGGEDNVYATPTSTYYKIKYNYLIVDQNIKFVEKEDEIKFLEVADNEDNLEVVIAADAMADPKNFKGLDWLTGFILAEGAEANIQLHNLVSAEGAFIQRGIVRVGGDFIYSTLDTYLGGSAADFKNIGKY